MRRFPFVRFVDPGSWLMVAVAIEASFG